MHIGISNEFYFMWRTWILLLGALHMPRLRQMLHKAHAALCWAHEYAFSAFSALSDFAFCQLHSPTYIYAFAVAYSHIFSIFLTLHCSVSLYSNKWTLHYVICRHANVWQMLECQSKTLWCAPNDLRNALCVLVCVGVFARWAAKELTIRHWFWFCRQCGKFTQFW